MANEKTITVDGKFTIKIGDTEMAVTREEAERLYSELYKALGKIDVYYQFEYSPCYKNPEIIWQGTQYVRNPRVIINNVTTCGNID